MKQSEKTLWARGLSEVAARVAFDKFQETDLSRATDLVQQFSRKAKGPVVNNHAAEAIARILLYAIANPQWRDEFASIRETDASVQRTREIAQALITLQRNLPWFIELWRLSTPIVSSDETIRLYEIVNKHQALIDAAPARARGKAPSLERELSTLIANKYLESAGAGCDLQTADAFAFEALSWLTSRPAPASETAIAKGRRRRT